MYSCFVARSVLSEKFKGGGGGGDRRNIHMLHGSIVHSVFQEILQQKVVDRSKMLEIAEKCLQTSQFLHEMLVA